MFSQTLYEVLRNQFLSKNISVEYDGKNRLSIPYDPLSHSLIEKIFCDLSSFENFTMRFLKQSEKAYFDIQLSHDDEPISVLFDRVLESIDSYEDNQNYLAKLDSMSRGVYQLFCHSFLYQGNFGVGIQIVENQKKCTVKTDISEYLQSLEEAGLFIKDNRTIIRETNLNVSADLFFQQILTSLKKSTNDYSDNKLDEKSSLKDEMTSTNVLDLHELYTKNDGFIDSSFPAENIDETQEIAPKMVKSLGEIPQDKSGRSNWVSLIFFLVIDIVAIALGLFLLLR